MDVIAPEGYGEIIGGGQRIHDLDLLLKRARRAQPAARSVRLVSRSAPVRHRAAWRLRHGRRALRGLDVRPGARPRNDRVPAHAVPDAALIAAIVSAAISVIAMHLARPWTSARDAAASIWALRPCVSRAERAAGIARLPGRGSGNVIVAQPESAADGPPDGAISAADRADLRAARATWSKARAEAASFRWCWAATTPSRSAPSPACRAIFQKQGRRIGLIWIDAHADMNTPESQPQRQCPWHAAGLLHRRWAAGTDAYLRLRSESGSAQRRDRRPARCGP